MIKVGNVWYPLSQKAQAEQAMFWRRRAVKTEKNKKVRHGSESRDQSRKKDNPPQE